MVFGVGNRGEIMFPGVQRLIFNKAEIRLGLLQVRLLRLMHSINLE